MKKHFSFFLIPSILFAFLTAPVAGAIENSPLHAGGQRIVLEEVYPGEMGYSAEEGTLFDKRILENEGDIRDALNQALGELADNCTLRVRDYDLNMLPKGLLALRQNFGESITFSPPMNSGQKGISTIRAQIEYNPAGRALREALGVVPLENEDWEAREILNAAAPILDSCHGMTEEEKIIRLHDVLVETVGFAEEDFPGDASDVYYALAEGLGSMRGYPETLHFLYSMAGLDSRMVVGQLLLGSGGYPRYFNKVKLDGEWYNVDALMDDPKPDRENRPLRGFLLVNDEVMGQRVNWEMKRYPSATAEDNWSMRYGIVADSPEALRQAVAKQLRTGAPFFTIWVPEYSSAVYKPVVSQATIDAYAKAGKTIRISYIGGMTMDPVSKKGIPGAVLFTFTIMDAEEWPA